MRNSGKVARFYDRLKSARARERERIAQTKAQRENDPVRLELSENLSRSTLESFDYDNK